MFAFFFWVSRGKELVRMDVDAIKHIPPALAFAATCIFDFQKNCWTKMDARMPSDAKHPDELVAVPHHTFFHGLGMCWYIMSDRRFTNAVRSNCAKTCEINAKMHLNVDSNAYYRLREHLRNGAYSGQMVDETKIIDEDDPAYNFFPL